MTTPLSCRISKLCRISRLSTLVGLVWLLAAGAQAQLQAQVFHSTFDDGDGSCSGLTPCPVVDVLNVWAVGPSIGCEDESCTVSCGEVCAIDTLIEVEGGSFSSISAEPGLVVQPACVDEGTPCSLPANTTSVHVVASFAGESTLKTGPRRLLQLELASGASVNSTAVSVNGVKLVDAVFSTQVLSTAIIALPEPTPMSGLLCGLAALSGLRWRRGERDVGGSR